MASMRAEAVAEILWELKKIEKLATYREVAQRAGFSAGAKGRTILTCLETVKRDWPHLQWWRVVPDDYCFPAKAANIELLRTNGYPVEAHPDQSDTFIIAEVSECVFTWDEEPTAAQAAAV